MKKTKDTSLTVEDYSSWKAKFIMELLKIGRKQMNKRKEGRDSKLLGLLQ